MVASRPRSQRRLRRTLEPLVTQAAATPGADRYRKHFPALAHLWVLLLHVFWRSPSLRSTHAMLTATERWWSRWGMTTAISLSQLARSSTSRPSACLEGLLTAAVATVRQQACADQDWIVLRRMVVLDSTFVRLSARLSPWSRYGGFMPGIRIQTMLELGRQLPTFLRMTRADTNDHTALWQLDLRAWRGWTVILDRGYYGHQQFARLQAAGVSFLARMSEQAHYRILQDQPLPAGPTPAGDTIVRDAVMRLGSANNRRGTVLDELRLVVSRNRRGHLLWLVTDRHDLPATDLVELYRKRWQIELFFRWLKRQLGLIRPLGRSRAAVWMTVLLVLIVAVISLLLEPDRPAGISRIAWLHQTALVLYLEAITDG